jgi:hypothetical protein
MDKTKSKDTYWVLANIVGIGIYLYFASGIWPVPDDTDLAAGTPIVWGLTVFPAFLLCSLMNIVWLTLIVSGGRRGKGWLSMRAWLLVVISWFAVNRLDSYNMDHGSAFRTGKVSSKVSTHPEKN